MAVSLPINNTKRTYLLKEIDTSGVCRQSHGQATSSGRRSPELPTNSQMFNVPDMGKQNGNSSRPVVMPGEVRPSQDAGIKGDISLGWVG